MTPTPVALQISAAARLELLHAAREQDEIDALVGEPSRDRLADALAGAGDERVSTFESEIHSCDDPKP